MEQLLTYDEVCRFLRLGKRTVERYVADGRLKRVKFDKNVRFRQRDLEEFVENYSSGGNNDGAEEMRQPEEKQCHPSTQDKTPHTIGHVSLEKLEQKLGSLQNIESMAVARQKRKQEI